MINEDFIIFLILKYLCNYSYYNKKNLWQPHKYIWYKNNSNINLKRSNLLSI